MSHTKSIIKCLLNHWIRIQFQNNLNPIHLFQFPDNTKKEAFYKGKENIKRAMKKTISEKRKKKHKVGRQQ